MENNWLEIAILTKRIRKERIIRVCAWHKRYNLKMAWWDGEEWTERRIAPGRQSHTFCPDCLKKFKKEHIK